MWFWLRLYAALMCGAGFLFVMVDGWLYSTGAITRRLTARACFLMGLLWPVFVFLLGFLMWRAYQRRH
ncbi:hypothetical protein VPZ60_004223 [Salmonella enterica]|nr:hypothetical protein [Salmonella enterica]